MGARSVVGAALDERAETFERLLHSRPLEAATVLARERGDDDPADAADRFDGAVGLDDLRALVVREELIGPLDGATERLGPAPADASSRFDCGNHRLVRHSGTTGKLVAS